MVYLILILAVLGILALVLTVAAIRLICTRESDPASSVTPPPVTIPPPAPTPPKPVVPVHTPVSASPSVPRPVRNHPDGEMDFFDVRCEKNEGIWVCPCCGMENTSVSTCQLCGYARS